MNRSFAKFAFAAAIVGSVVAAQAQSFTVATFADPTIGMANPTPMFRISPGVGNGTLSGSWAGDGLTLETWMGTFNDVEFVMADVATTQIVVGFWTVGEGSVVFSTDTDSNLLTIAFDSGSLTPNGVGGSDFWGNNVTFSGTLAPGASFTDEAFGFAFANPRADGNDVTFTASFTSSAVPEPASFAALGLGAIALLRRRKKA
jgi:hypothetical protein